MGSHVAPIAGLGVGTTPDAPGAVATATGLALAVVLLLVFDVALRHVLTAVHEGGHVVGLVLFGAGVSGVRVERRDLPDGGSTSVGETTSRGPLSFLDKVVALALGYIAAPLAGLLAAELLGRGQASAVLWISAVGYGLLTLMVKNWLGRFTTLTAAFVFVLVARRADPFLATVAACTWSWMLITGGLQQLLQDWWNADDFDQLWGWTLIPQAIWAIAYAWLIVVIAILAGLVLVGAREPWL